MTLSETLFEVMDVTNILNPTKNVLSMTSQLISESRIGLSKVLSSMDAFTTFPIKTSTMGFFKQRTLLHPLKYGVSKFT